MADDSKISFVRVKPFQSQFSTWRLVTYSTCKLGIFQHVGKFFNGRKRQFFRIFGRFELSSSQFDREQLTSSMYFPVIGECLGWRTTDFEELYGDLLRLIKAWVTLSLTHIFTKLRITQLFCEGFFSYLAEMCITTISLGLNCGSVI